MAAWGDLHYVTGAGWSVAWRISQQKGSGLEVWHADFRGRRVLWRGTMPVAIVPYHRPMPGNEPPPPHHSYKDGLSPQCKGAAFTALRPNAPNTWVKSPSPWFAVVDTDAVDVHIHPATGFGPAHLAITAKFQCGWYQYVHSWEFDSDGAIHPRVAMGGKLNPNVPDKAHVHHFYFRIDLDIDGFSRDLVEVFNHNSLTDPPGDTWTLVPIQSKLFAAPSLARNWRVRDATSTNALGQRRAYDIEIPQTAGRDQFSTGDVWVTVFRGDNVQQGVELGMALPPILQGCDDRALEVLYAQGPLDTVNGNDIVVWVAVHSHHVPRHLGEEVDHLPYHFAEFSITPRNFEVFRGGG
jgi:Cu2+-containing amine oxidase